MTDDKLIDEYVALVTSVKNDKSKVGLAVAELSLSVAGPVLLGLMALLGTFDPGV